MTDDVAAIEERLNKKAAEPQPESWQATEAGDQLTGRFRRLERGTTSFGDCWIAIVESLRNPGRLASVWLFHTTLLNAFKKAAPREGEVVLIQYDGKQHRDGASDYHLWKVVVDRAGGSESAYSWNDVAGGDPLHEADAVPASTAGSLAEDGVAEQQAQVATADDDIPF
jgi:hypothetical protein